MYYKIAKIMNSALFIGFFSVFVLNNFILAEAQASFSSAIVFFFVLILFFIPNFMVIRTLSPWQEWRKSTVTFLVLWSACIVAVLTTREQALFTVVIFSCLFAVNIANLVLIVLAHRKVESL